jgi:hypothetical protein
MRGETTRQRGRSSQMRRGQGSVSEPSSQADGQQPIPPMPPDLTIRVRTIDCMLADIQAQIQILRQERTHLGLVRRELAGMEAKQIGSSPCVTSLEE